MDRKSKQARRSASAHKEFYDQANLGTPDMSELLVCVAEYYQKIIELPSKQTLSASKNLEIFDERKYPISYTNVEANKVPHMIVILLLLNNLVRRGRVTPEALVISVIFMERVRRQTGFTLYPNNWRRAILISVITAVKAHEETAVWNIDFIDLFPRSKISDVNSLETAFLNLLRFNCGVKVADYTNMFFELRTKSPEVNRKTPEQQYIEKLKKHSEKSMMKRMRSLDDVNMVQPVIS